MLTEVEVVQTKSPIRITKDTIEFNASFYKTRSNAVVEDLLKKIPGIQIDDDGTIWVNGKIVQSIMVDGRQLFNGGGTNIISKNLQADLIDKVQLIDRTQNNEKRRGLNNNEADNIINITIKKSKRDRFSGELSGAYGTSDRFASKINLSRFGEHQQLMILGDGNNVNGATTTNNMGGRGIIRSYSGGGSYSKEVNKKITISVNYLTNNNSSIEQRSSTRNTIIGDSSFFYNQQTNNQTKNSSHDLSVQVDYKIDSLQSISISKQASLSQGRSFNLNNYESLGNNAQKINTGNMANSGKNESMGISGSLRYDKKFKKKDRSIAITIAYGKDKKKDNSTNISNNIYFPPNLEIISDTINQNTLGSNNNQRLFLMITYTEPINKHNFITFLIANDYTYNISDIKVSNFNIASKLYDIPNDSLSSNFKSDPTQHYMKVSWLYQKEKLDYSISLGTMMFKMKNNEISSYNSYTTLVNSILPDANLNYLFDNNRRIRFSYRKSQDFPQISQMQPYRNNSDPLHILIGNQSLKPMSTHNIDLSYNTFNTSSFRNFSIYMNGKFVRDQIISASWYDDLGRETIQPININGSYNISVNINNGIPLKQKPNSLTFNTRGILSRSMNYTNGSQSFHKDLVINQSVGYHHEYKEALRYTFSTSVGYNKVRYSTMQIGSFNYISGNISFTGDLNLPGGITISSNASYTWGAGRTKGYDINPIMLHASISKSLFSHQQGLIRLQGFDLLRQNTNITRNIQANYIEDVKTNTLEQFFIVGFSYFLGKNKN